MNTKRSSTVKRRLAVLVGAAALMLAPTAALAANGSEHASEHAAHTEYTPQPTPGPKASLPEKAKAYGFYCRGASKEHVKGEKGTAFSQCVTLAAKMATHPKMTPKAACKGVSKKHMAGEKRTPFAQCVVAAAQLKKELSAT
jgi:hypothetical protein